MTHTRPIASSVACIVALATFGACSKDKKESSSKPEASKVSTPTPTPKAEDVAPAPMAKPSMASTLTKHLPADTEVVISVGFPDLVSSPQWKQVQEALTKSEGGEALKEFKELCGFDALATLQAFVVGVQSKDPEHPTLVVAGFERDKVVACLKAKAKKDNDSDFSLDEEGPLTVVTSSKKGDNLTLGWINPTTFVVTPDKNDKTWLNDRIAGKTTLKPELKTMLNAANQNAPIWFAATIASGSPIEGGLGAMTDGAKPLGGYGSLGFVDGMHLDLGIRFNSGEEAQKMLQQLQPMLGIAKTQLGPAGRFVDKVMLKVKDADLTMILNLTSAELDSLSKIAESAVGEQIGQ